MTRSMIRILMLVMITSLDACDNTTSNIKPDNNLSYSPVTPTQTPQTPRTYKQTTYSGVFQKPGELEPAVEFWRKTYTAWYRSQVAIHDDRYLDVIYEVMVIPGDVAESLTTEQKEMVKNRREYWKTYLFTLENKVRGNEALSATDRQIVDKFKMTGKPVLSSLTGATERVRSQRGTRERFVKGVEISHHYEKQFKKIFHDHGLPEDLAYLPHVESSFQPSAKSSAGAVGMWQFTKSAAKTFMPSGDKVDKRLDPIASATGAAKYLSHAYKKLGDWPAAITSYNHGIGGMKRAQNQVGRNFVDIVENYDGPAFGFASRNYYAQFLAAREIANNPSFYIR